MATGWTWQTILDEVDLPRLESLNKYWKNFPPVHVSLRRLLNHAGIATTAPTKTEGSSPEDEADAAALMANFPSHN